MTYTTQQVIDLYQEWYQYSLDKSVNSSYDDFPDWLEQREQQPNADVYEASYNAWFENQIDQSLTNPNNNEKEI